MYDKNTKYGGWRLLSRTCYKINKFKKLLSPEEIGFTRIGPKCFNDPGYDKQLVKHLRDGSLRLVSLTGNQINPFYAIMTLENTTDKDKPFEISKGMIIEVDKFQRVQNLAVTGTITIKHGKVDNLESIDRKTFIIKAHSTETITLHMRCIDPPLSSPSGKEKYTVKAFIHNKAATEDPKTMGTLRDANYLSPEEVNEIFDTD